MKIVESDKVINIKINKALAGELNSRFKKQKEKLLNTIKGIVYNAIRSCPEIDSLSNGELKLDFGLTVDPSSAIINAIVSSVEVIVTPFSANGGTISKGGITILIQPNDYQNLLGLSVSQQPIESGGSLPWLEWLLLEGDSIIIANFGVEYSNEAKGRAGPARMTSSNRPFKVNPNFSGTRDDNFITRALKTYFPQIEKAIAGVLK